eukprot:9105561-Alexandrium_andersonii.AAC.1
MRHSSFTACKSFASPLRRPSILHMNFSFRKFSTTSASTSYPAKAKSSPCTTHRASNLAV